MTGRHNRQTTTRTIGRPFESHSGARENILMGPKHFRGAPLGEKIVGFSFQNGAAGTF